MAAQDSLELDRKAQQADSAVRKLSSSLSLSFPLCPHEVSDSCLVTYPLITFENNRGQAWKT